MLAQIPKNGGFGGENFRCDLGCGTPFNHVFLVEEMLVFIRRDVRICNGVEEMRNGGEFFEFGPDGPPL